MSAVGGGGDQEGQGETETRLGSGGGGGGGFGGIVIGSVEVTVHTFVMSHSSNTSGAHNTNYGLLVTLYIVCICTYVLNTGYYRESQDS